MGVLTHNGRKRLEKLLYAIIHELAELYRLDEAITVAILRWLALIELSRDTEPKLCIALRAALQTWQELNKRPNLSLLQPLAEAVQSTMPTPASKLALIVEEYETLGSKDRTLSSWLMFNPRMYKGNIFGMVWCGVYRRARLVRWTDRYTLFIDTDTGEDVTPGLETVMHKLSSH